MRAKLLFPALLLASVAAAQTTVVDLGPTQITAAYQNFAQDAYAHWLVYPNDALTFDLTGTEATGGTTIPIRALLYWRISRDPRTGTNSRAQVELDVYDMAQKGTPLSLRIVGDGATLYRYDMARSTVSTTAYSFPGTRVPAAYAGSDAPKLLAQLKAATPGFASYLVRLVAEMGLSGGESLPNATDWLPVSPAVGRLRRTFDEVPVPMYRPNKVIEASTVTDPVTGNLFVRGDDPFVFYGMDSTATDRTVTFHLADPTANADNPRYEVQNVTLSRRASDRLVNLRLTPPVIGPAALTSPAWTFVPFTGTQAAAFRPVNAGGH